jgi:hypothetical protein
MAQPGVGRPLTTEDQVKPQDSPCWIRATVLSEPQILPVPRIEKKCGGGDGDKDTCWATIHFYTPGRDEAWECERVHRISVVAAQSCRQLYLHSARQPKQGHEDGVHSTQALCKKWRGRNAWPLDTLDDSSSSKWLYTTMYAYRLYVRVRVCVWFTKTILHKILWRRTPISLSQSITVMYFSHITFHTSRKYNKALINRSIIFVLAVQNKSLENLSPKR